MNSLKKTIAWLTIFSIAMGFMETAVVVYLRKLYYPHGFSFPLVPIDPDIGLVEFFREAATIIMLLGVGLLVGKRPSQKFAFFIYCFAIWDLFYYVFLKLLLDWPESLFTWDILFLIPVPWVGPVLTPCLLSLAMIVFCLAIVHFQEKGKNTRILWREWWMLIAGSLTVILSFVWDYFQYIGRYPGSAVWTLSSKQGMFNEIATYIPGTFNWLLFLIGFAAIVAGIAAFVWRVARIK